MLTRLPDGPLASTVHFIPMVDTAWSPAIKLPSYHSLNTKLSSLPIPCIMNSRLVKRTTLRSALPLQPLQITPSLVSDFQAGRTAGELGNWRLKEGNDNGAAKLAAGRVKYTCSRGKNCSLNTSNRTFLFSSNVRRNPLEQREFKV